MKIPHEQIKRLRIQKNISQVDMAKAADMSRSAYISFEKNGSENLPLKSAVGIANKLNISFSELFNVDESQADLTKIQQVVFSALEEYESTQVFMKSGFFNELDPNDQIKFEEFRENLKSFKYGVYATLVNKGFCSKEDIKLFRDAINPNK